MGTSRVIVFALLCASCATQQNKTLTAHIEGALDMTARAVDPSYKYAMEACAVRDTQLTDIIEQKLGEPEGAKAASDAERDLNALRDRCERTKDAFETIRAAHEEAIKLVEEGYPERAEVLLGQINDGWDLLKGGE